MLRFHRYRITDLRFGQDEKEERVSRIWQRLRIRPKHVLRFACAAGTSGRPSPTKETDAVVGTGKLYHKPSVTASREIGGDTSPCTGEVFVGRAGKKSAFRT